MDASGEVRIDRTGIALVHEGEYIVATPGSAAELSEPGAAQRVVNYHFPVQVDVVGELDGTLLDQVARHVFEELDTALRSAG
jgi:hypothetical protein